MRYGGNNTGRTDERTDGQIDVADGQRDNIMPSQTLSVVNA